MQPSNITHRPSSAALSSLPNTSSSIMSTSSTFMRRSQHPSISVLQWTMSLTSRNFGLKLKSYTITSTLLRVISSLRSWRMRQESRTSLLMWLVARFSTTRFRWQSLTLSIRQFHAFWICFANVICSTDSRKTPLLSQIMGMSRGLDTLTPTRKFSET